MAGRSHNGMIHRLVALAFYGPKPEGAVLVRHLNGNKCDNHWTNLAYGTVRDNADDMVRLDEQFRGTRNKHAKLNEARVEEIRQHLRQGRTLASLGRQYGVDPVTIAAVRDGRTWWHVPCAI